MRSQHTLRVFLGGFKNTFFWSAGATDECNGKSHSEDSPPKRYEAASLSCNLLISDMPQKVSPAEIFQSVSSTKQNYLSTPQGGRGKSYRQENKNGPITRMFINITHQVFKKIVINYIFIQLSLQRNKTDSSKQSILA